MRISSNLFFQTGLNSINAQQADLVHLYKQVGSGQRMVSPSDDPLAAAQAINVSQTLAMNERYASNRAVAQRNLGTQENLLNNVTLQLQDVKTRLVEAGNGTLSDADRHMLAEVLQGARDSLLNLANSTDGNGVYMFSGSKGNSAPFSESGVYLGDSSQRMVQVDQTRQMATADLGIDIFSRAAPGSTGFVTIPSDANTGAGVFGKTVISNPQGPAFGKTVEIRFTSETAYEVSIDGVVQMDESVTPAVPMSHAYTSDKILGGAYGVEVGFTGVPQAGDTFTLIPQSSSYSLSKGNTLSVANVTELDAAIGKFTIEFDEANGYTVTSNATPEVTGLTITNTGSAEKPVLEISDGSGELVAKVALYAKPTPGAAATIEPGSGSTSRDELNIFATLDAVIAALGTPTGDAASAAKLQNALNSALQRVDTAYDNVLSVRASAGTRMNELSALDSSGAARTLEYRNQLSQLEDLDYYTAITQLQLRTTALEAASMAFQKIQNTSLFNMNR